MSIVKKSIKREKLHLDFFPHSPIMQRCVTREEEGDRRKIGI